uniref:Uncharacterized protein n=1 Tax=Anguilla anguilla TaxID=7936 RepID=A0A0E9P9D8_ANGAN
MCKGDSTGLRMKLKDIHAASLRNTDRGERVRARRLLPEDFPVLDELTPSEVEYILNSLEKFSELSAKLNVCLRATRKLNV